MRGPFIILVLALAVDFGCGGGSVLVASDSSSDTEAWEWDAVDDPDSDSPEGEAPCLHDSDCQNGLVCDDQERCMDGVCVPGEPLICDDRNDCTIDACSEEEAGCVYTLRDLDGDGFGDAACGGADCDDSRDDVYPGAPGGCSEGEDLNCTGTPDLDDDQDGYVDADCPGGDDCDDNDPDTYPGATEVCLDGKDQDCDGIVDGPMLMASSVKVSDFGSNLSLVWTGSEYGIAQTGIYFRRVSADGEGIGEETVVSESYCAGLSCSSNPSMVWTGSEFVISYRCQQDDYGGALCFTRLDREGQNVTGDIVLSPYTHDSGKAVALAWTGSILGFTWNEYSQYGSQWSNYIHFKATYPTGEDATSDIILDENARGVRPQLTWTGSEFGVVWYCAGICFARVSDGGDMVGEYVQVVPSSDISLPIPPPAWTGSEYGIVWAERRIEENGPQIYFARLSSIGEKIGDDILLSDPSIFFSRNPSIKWIGSEFAVAWIASQECCSGLDFKLFFNRVSATETETGEEMELAEATLGDSFPMDIVWTGRELGVVWVWTTGTPPNGTYFNRIGFCD